MQYDDTNLELDPGWRRALRTWASGTWKPGDVVSDAWLYTELGTTPPASGTKEDFDKFRLKWLAEFSRFHERLRDEFQLALIRDEGGYRVLTASEQLSFARDEGRRRIKSALRWQAEMLHTTNVGALTSVEQSAHADAMARLARLRSFSRQLTLPTTTALALDAPSEKP